MTNNSSYVRISNVRRSWKYDADSVKVCSLRAYFLKGLLKMFF